VRDFGVDFVAVGDLGGDQLARQLPRCLVAFRLREVPLEDRIGRSLTKIRFEDRRQREPASGPPASDVVSPQRRRPGR
jgi:hypothetical protein